MLVIVRKGSTFFGKINITDRDHNGILLAENDKLIFAVKKHLYDDTETPVIKKIITADRQFEGGYCFELTPEETDLTPDTYYYDIGVQRENGEFYHVCKPCQFNIHPSITRKENQNEIL